MNRGKWKQNRYYVFYGEYFRKRSAYLAALILLIVAGVVVGNLNPFVYGRIIDFITSSNLDGVTLYILIYAAINIFAVGLSAIEAWIGRVVSFKIGSDVKKRLFAKIMRMRFKGLDSYRVGELISRLDSDAATIVDFYINIGTSIALIVFNLAVSVYFVVTISAALSLVAVFYIPATVAVTLVFRKKFKELEHRLREFNDAYFSFANETFSNLRPLRAYSLETSFDDKFADYIQRLLKLTKRSAWLNNAMSILIRTISTASSLLIIYFSAKLIIDGRLTLGSMVAFNTYINKLYDSVSQILSMNMNFQSVAVSMNRVNKLLDENDERPLYDGETAKFKSLRFVDVCFGYGDKPVIHKLSMELVTPGLYAVVGKNGCGKTTLARLIMGFYDADGGSILFDGKTIAEVGLHNLRSNITYIQKQPFILNASVMENLKITAPYVTEACVAEVCERLGLGAVISALPEGYDASLGESGLLLSSGQRQKLSLARAFLRNSRIVIFDEVTSDLDGIAENEIVSHIRELAKDRIVLFISHKISSIIDSDKILLLNNSGIEDSGTHAELLSRSPLYREIFHLEQN